MHAVGVRGRGLALTWRGIECDVVEFRAGEHAEYVLLCRVLQL